VSAYSDVYSTDGGEIAFGCMPQAKCSRIAKILNAAEKTHDWKAPEDVHFGY